MAKVVIKRSSQPDHDNPLPEKIGRQSAAG